MRGFWDKLCRLGEAIMWVFYESKDKGITLDLYKKQVDKDIDQIISKE